MTVAEIAAPDLYDELARGDLATERSRLRIADLSMRIAQALRDSLSARGTPPHAVLCVFILRGGALMLPGFVRHMAGSPFCLLALKRDVVDGAARPIYCSDLPESNISTIVYVDSIAASGGTVDVARSMMRRTYSPSHEVLAVVASSTGATGRFAEDGMDVIGVSLFEKIESGMLAPDLGRLDAGDILSGIGLVGDRHRSAVP